MSITLTSVKAEYLARVAEGLDDLSDEDREEVIQDLEAHLAELEDDEVVTTLGEPAVFVAEFRVSAGLAEPDRRRGALIEDFRERLNRGAARLGEITHWSSVRPIWIWSRGWLTVGVIAAVNETIAFQHFPIPTIGSSLTGLIVVIAATLFSVWLERLPRRPIRDMASIAYSIIGIWSLAVGLISPIALGAPEQFHESEFPFDQMIAPDGTSIQNIYAYDLDGRPVDVLLFDQDGRPLLNLPSYVYEDAEFNPGESEVFYEFGAVRFQRDEFGRIIPNL